MAQLELEVDPASKLERLERIEREYLLTIRVLAVVVEQFLRHNVGEWVEISDEILADTPDLHAWRDSRNHRIVITTER